MSRETRTRLLDAGLASFAARGLAGTTVTSVEAEAGLRRGSGSFYRHFPSKESLFAAVIERELDRARAAFEDNVVADAEVADVRVVLTLEFRRVLATLPHLDALTAIVARDHDALGPLAGRVDATLRDGLDINAELLESLMRSGRIPDRNPRALAVVMTDALLGYHLTRGILDRDQGQATQAEVIDVLVDLLVT